MVEHRISALCGQALFKELRVNKIKFELKLRTMPGGKWKSPGLAEPGQFFQSKYS